MTTSRLASPAHGITLILLAAVSVGAWAVHVFALSALARLHQHHPGVIWVMQGTTLLTALPCLAAIGVGWWWLRGTTTPSDEGSPTGRTVFLCWMAILIGCFSLLLIVLEATFVSALHGYA
jgi:hypothetical protein